jgi:hypothetical protein
MSNLRSDGFMPATKGSQARTQAFAGVMRPFLAIVPIVANHTIRSLLKKSAASAPLSGAPNRRRGAAVPRIFRHRLSPVLVELGCGPDFGVGSILALRGLVLMAAVARYRRAGHAMD